MGFEPTTSDLGGLRPILSGQRALNPTKAVALQIFKNTPIPQARNFTAYVALECRSNTYSTIFVLRL